MNKLKIAVLGSTRGTDLQAVIDAINSKELDAEIAIVISDKEDAYILERAKIHGIEAMHINPKNFQGREEFDNAVANEITKRNIDLILLIGYMRFLSKGFVGKFSNRIMNIHPSLLPAFAGGMDKNVHAAVLEHGCKVSGCTLHFVDETPDAGPIIMQKAVQIEETETVDSLKEKVQKAEQEIILQAIMKFQEGKIKVEGRRVKIL
ncbi:MAG: phosphoribosylglycinamide formyltransferase [Candidatus Diapherotrites archaeon]|nr:phosphoribosylglycinamide formyltransferase [Candidatus Diapherotrites archaeon]